MNREAAGGAPVLKPELLKDPDFWLDGAALLVPALLAPFLLFPRLEWMWGALAIPLLWAVRLLAKRRPFPANPLNLLLVPLLFMVAVSLYATFDVEFSLGKIAGTLLGVFAFWGIVQFARTGLRIRLLLAGFCASGLLLAVLSLVATRWTTKFPGLSSLAASLPVFIQGLPGAEEGFYPNAVGGTMILFVPLLLFLSLDTFRRREGGRILRLVLLASLILVSGVLALSQSRGAWAGLAGAFLILAAFRWRLVRWMLLPALAVLPAAASFFTSWEQVRDTPFFSQGELSLAYRLEVWDRAVYGIQDFAFTGMGMNTFRKVVHLLYPLFSVPPDTDIASAHNHILQAALDLGIPGMVAYAALWSALALVLYRVRRYAADRWQKICALGLGAGLLAQFLFQMTDALPLGAKVGIFWWMAAALSVSLYLQVRNGPAPPWKPSGVRMWEVPVCWVLFSLVAISLIGDHPYLGLAAATAGGIVLGLLAVLSFDRCQTPG